MRLLGARPASELWLGENGRRRTLASFARFSAECSHVEADSVVPGRNRRGRADLASTGGGRGANICKFMRAAGEEARRAELVTGRTMYKKLPIAERPCGLNRSMARIIV